MEICSTQNNTVHSLPRPLRHLIKQRLPLLGFLLGGGGLGRETCLYWAPASPPKPIPMLSALMWLPALRTSTQSF